MVRDGRMEIVVVNGKESVVNVASCVFVILDGISYGYRHLSWRVWVTVRSVSADDDLAFVYRTL